MEAVRDLSVDELRQVRAFVDSLQVSRASQNDPLPPPEDEPL
jgi:hypothetical protein